MREISEFDASMCAAVAATLASIKGSWRNGNFVKRIAGMALSYTACKDQKFFLLSAYWVTLCMSLLLLCVRQIAA